MILTLFKKELLELTRDRRALLISLIVPALALPLLLLLFGGLSSLLSYQQANQTLNYALVGESIPYPISASFTREAGFQRLQGSLSTEAQARQALLDEQLDFVLLVPDQHLFNQTALATTPAWRVLYRSDDLRAALLERVNSALQPAIDAWQLAQLGQTYSADQAQQLLHPLPLTAENLAAERLLTGELVGVILAYLLVFAAMLGALYPSVDMIVGEKERQTFETLLLSPLSTVQIVLGKLALTSTTSILAMICTLTTLLLTYALLLPLVDAELVARITLPGLGELLLILLLMMPLALINAAAFMAAVAFARSLKEAQSLVTPVSTLTFLPPIVAMLPGVKLTGIWHWIPISNIALAVKGVARGDLSWSSVVLVLAVNGVLVWALVRLCIQRLSADKQLQAR